MKNKNSKAYRETYQKWMEKQTEINRVEALLKILVSDADELKQQLDEYRRQQNG